MTLYQLWDPTVQFQTRSGNNLVNGSVKVTHLDRTDLAPVYDFDGKAMQNPVTLDENGRASVYAEVNKLYTIRVYDQDGQLIYTQNIREYPKDVTVTVPTIVSTDSIEATLAGDTYSLNVKKFAGNTQTVTYDVTKWSDIDFTKQLMLRYVLRDTVVSSATYTCTDTALKFYVDIENEVYVVQLLHDTDAWSATKVDASSVYEAVWGAPLAYLNSISSDVLVYTKNDGDVYMCSYRSDAEWRFTCIDGDVIYEATVIEQGWTENVINIGGSYTAGYGLTLMQGEFDVNTDVIATVEALNTKQNKLTAGDLIHIADNVISAANVLKPTDISTLPNADFNALPADNVLYYKNSSVNFANQPERGAYRFIQWTSAVYFSVQLAVDGNNQLFARSSFRSAAGTKTWRPWVKFQESLTPGQGINITSNTIRLKYTTREI